MDPKLAEIYGTNKPDEADVEKLAAAELAEKLASENGVDLENMSEEELEQTAAELLASGEGEGEGEGEAPAGDEPEAGTEKTAQEKLDEADYLGRVMAHAYVQELKEIDKTAAAEMDKEAKGKMPAGLAGKVGKHLKGLAGKAKGMAEAGGKKAKHFAKKHPGAMKGMSHGAAGAAGVAAGAAAHKAMSKKSSAMDTLVEARMAQILEESGIDPEKLVEQEQTKTSGADKGEVLANAVEERAWAELARFGVVPSEEAAAE